MKNRKLVINETEAGVVRRIFERFAKGSSVTTIAKELAAEGFRNKYGQALDKGRIYKLLNNRVYVGDAVHKGTAYPGEHEAIIPQRLWDMVHAILSEAPRVRANRNRAQTPALLKGLIFGPDGRAMSPTHTRRGDKLYRYYVSQSLIRGVTGDAAFARLPAGEVDAAVIDQIRALLRSPEIIVATWRAARREIAGLTEAEVREALERLDPLWDELFPAEQARIVRLLIERVDVAADGMNVRLRVDGLASILSDVIEPARRAA